MKVCDKCGEKTKDYFRVVNLKAFGVDGYYCRKCFIENKGVA